MDNGSTELPEEGKAIRHRRNAPVHVGRADSSETGFGVRFKKLTNLFGEPLASASVLCWWNYHEAQ